MARLKETYIKKIVPAMTKEFGYTNPMAGPKIQKISVNIGLGEATGNSKLMDGAVNELSQIAGQRPVINKARKSIAAFKLREGMAIGSDVVILSRPPASRLQLPTGLDHAGNFHGQRQRSEADAAQLEFS